jgi:hypothetical protein
MAVIGECEIFQQKKEEKKIPSTIEKEQLLRLNVCFICRQIFSNT